VPDGFENIVCCQ